MIGRWIPLNSAKTVLPLVADGAKDLSLDFGFVRPEVTVGDFVWVDENKNGVQDEGEKPLPGVELVLTGPDGKPVVNVNGDPVVPVKTDASGKYLFEKLPVLKPGQSYKVCVKAPAGYVPTKPGATSRDKDSSTGCATTEGLTRDGESDLTLDFGFYPRPKVKLPKTGV
ncbi:SdrD B-like domain-containing protein [Tessaracoccus sp. OH4464_COT-324]|uniref:SdrD B-like domain-containing protein n=1 Tax=Tessaracoccus sp. OH4464_COT-324 TaxID=2491059 RepID=UPI0018F2E287|nr:SdrD B-like domain-containing protein [Tessaracoccus sp. OH4464_COT-324]